MRSSITAVLVITIVAFFTVSCETERLKPQRDNSGRKFFPLKIGSYRIYDVEEINFSFVAENDTAKYQLKVLIADFYINQQADTTFFIERYHRPMENETWELNSLWTTRETPGQIIVTENNIPFVKLAYPVKEGLTWDGNALNIMEEDEYHISDFNITFETASQKFENVIQVIENDNEDTVIFQDFRTSFYAEGIGLIYKEVKIINYCATTVECLGEGIIESGRKYKQQIVTYGNE